MNPSPMRAYMRGRVRAGAFGGCYLKVHCGNMEKICPNGVENLPIRIHFGSFFAFLPCLLPFSGN